VTVHASVRASAIEPLSAPIFEMKWSRRLLAYAAGHKVEQLIGAANR
jgi:hypothetical protein